MTAAYRDNLKTTLKMTDSTQQADALLTEHFQYTPLVRALQIILP